MNMAQGKLKLSSLLFNIQFINYMHCIHDTSIFNIHTCLLFCIDGVVIAAQCTATFSDLLCSPEFRYY